MLIHVTQVHTENMIQGNGKYFIGVPDHRCTLTGYFAWDISFTVSCIVKLFSRAYTCVELHDEI